MIISHLLSLYDADDLNVLFKMKQSIKKMRVNDLEEDEDWKISILEELSLAVKGLLEVDMGIRVMTSIIEVVATA